jgi:hypothetical protein
MQLDAEIAEGLQGGSHDYWPPGRSDRIGEGQRKGASHAKVGLFRDAAQLGDKRTRPLEKLNGSRCQSNSAAVRFDEPETHGLLQRLNAFADGGLSEPEAHRSFAHGTELFGMISASMS